MQRLRAARALDVRVTQREAFDAMVEYARLGEEAQPRPNQNRPVPHLAPLPPPLKPPSAR